MRLGFHISIAGGIQESVPRAKMAGCGTMQIFSRNPRGWKALKLDREDAVVFRRARKEAGIHPVLVHIPYLINLASPDNELYKRSIDSYKSDIARADLLGAEYFVTHMGSHRGSGEKAGLERFANAIIRVIREVQPAAMILLETTAGTGSSLGYKFEHIAYVIKRSGKAAKEGKVGVCLDTQHVFAAGYDISGALEETLKEFDDIISLDKLKAVHLNDSKSGLGSRVDRHENIGKGLIGPTALGRVLNHPKLRHLPFVMETPARSPKDDIDDMKAARRLCKKEYYED